MNKERITKLETAIDKLYDALELIDECAAEEKEAVESIYYSERPEILRFNIDVMSDTSFDVEGAIINLQDLLTRYGVNKE